MRWAAVVAFAASTAWAQGAPGWACVNEACDELFRNGDAGIAAPLFSFASPTAYRGYPAYAGLPATDGCKDPATVTGTKGEALTFTRATASSCCTDAVGAAAASCATLEQCTSGQVCIQSRGLRVSRGYMETTRRTEELDSAAWASDQSAVAAVTVSADYGAAPDGTTTAERLQFAATTGTQYTNRYQTGGCPTSGDATLSAWVRGTGGSGVMDMCINAIGGVASCSDVAFTTTWQRFTKSGTISALGNVSFGNMTNFNGGVARSANDVQVWGVNCTNTAYAMPYVRAEGTAVTVNAETATFAAPAAIAAVSAAGSAGFNFLATWPAASGVANWTGMLIGASGRINYWGGTPGTPLAYDGTNTITLTGGGHAANVSTRFGAKWTGSALTIKNFTDSVSATGSFDGAFGTGNDVGVCYSTTVLQGDGICGNVCLDSDPARCFQ